MILDFFSRCFQPEPERSLAEIASEQERKLKAIVEADKIKKLEQARIRNIEQRELARIRVSNADLSYSNKLKEWTQCRFTKVTRKSLTGKAKQGIREYVVLRQKLDDKGQFSQLLYTTGGVFFYVEAVMLYFNPTDRVPREHNSERYPQRLTLTPGDYDPETITHDFCDLSKKTFYTKCLYDYLLPRCEPIESAEFHCDRDKCEIYYSWPDLKK